MGSTPHWQTVFDSIGRIWPFLDRGGEKRTVGEGIRDLGIEAIFVFHDPRDWGRDIQLMLDVLVPAKREKVELFFCNPDMWWKADYPRPRMGQGAFREAFQGVHQVGFVLSVDWKYLYAVVVHCRVSLSRHCTREAQCDYI